MKSLAVSMIRGLMVLLSRLPLKFHYFMGDVLSWLAMNMLHYRTGMVWKNISRSFPDMNYRDLKKVYKDFYRHFGEIFAEAIWFGGSSYERLRKNGIVTVMNPEEVSAMYESSPSLTVLSTHCGNREILGGLLGYRTATGGKISFGEKAISVVYKKLTNEVSDRVFALNRIAPLTEVGTECEVESKEILRYSIRHKDEKRVYIYPTDQAPYYKSGPHPIGMFMHQDTKAMLGSVGVACKLSHSVMYMKMKRVERGRYEMSFIPICQDASAMKPEDIMRKYYDLLEEEINETPHNWLWTHNRWK
jgi:KDO2-lipid IV(A) lauroyltransferase